MGPWSPSQQLNPLAQPFVAHASSSHPSPHCVTYSSISIGHIPLAPPFLPDSGRQTTKTPNQPAQLPSSFSVLSLNCRSIVNKLAELSQVCEQYSPDIICLCETWLTAAIDVSIPGYTSYRLDCPPTTSSDNLLARGYGGVATLVADRSFMSIKRRYDLERCGLETVWLEWRPVILPSLPLIICSIYRPPGDSISQVQAFSDLLEDFLSNISLPNSAIVLAGDLNARHSDWSPRDTTNHAGREFRNLFSCFGLEQMVTFPTHFTPHGSTYTDHTHLLLSVTSLAPLGASDHAQILSHFILPTDAVYREEPAANGHPAAAPQYHFRNVPGKPEYDFKSVPSSVWDSVNAELADIDWSWHLRASNVNDALSHFSSILNSALEKHLWPFGKQPYSHRCPRPSQPPWVDAHLRTAIKWKYDLYSMFKKYPTQQNKQAYQQQRNIVKTLTWTKYRAE